VEEDSTGSQGPQHLKRRRKRMRKRWRRKRRRRMKRMKGRRRRKREVLNGLSLQQLLPNSATNPLSVPLGRWTNMQSFAS
jgi:hypothetical protein